MDPMEAIRQTFFQECDDQLAELERGLMAMDGGDADPETINAVFRAVHSIKGGAGAFGLDDLVRFAHVFETALDHVRAGRLEMTAERLAVMLRATDALADLVRAARDGTPGDAAPHALADELRHMGAETPDGADDPAHAAGADDMDGLVFQPVQVDLAPVMPLSAPDEAWVIRFRPHAAMYANANETGLLFRELQRLALIDVALDPSDIPLLGELDPDGAYLSWTVRLPGTVEETAIRDVFEFVDGDCDLAIDREGAGTTLDPIDADSGGDIAALIEKVRGHLAPRGSDPEHAAPSAGGGTPAKPPREQTASAPASAGAAPTIRVDLDRVDRLIDIVGELVIHQAMLAQRVAEAGISRAPDVSTALDELEQLTREIQDSVMAIRAQPVRSVFQRMPRLVREVAALTRKSVRLMMEGETTEVDKTVIEQLSDPLTHMIRNAIDHGLESPDRRVAAGKPAEGTVRLTALHRSGRIVIEVADDGGGIDRDRVKAIALSRGLIAADAALTDEDADNLIFLPGFSTAATVSDVSGRGVGMDVVRRSVQQLGGRISIASRPGQGSTFTLSLPLTLAVLDGMVVSAADQPLVIPLANILETMQLKASDVRSLCGDARVIAIRESFVPLIDLGRALGFRSEDAAAGSGVVVLIETEAGGRAALQLDTIQGQRQVVIKSLEANCGRIPGVAGATVLGNGRVALIVDVDAVSSAASADSARLEPSFAMAG